MDRWVIDASLSRDGLLCFCPIEGDLAGEFYVVVGMNYLSDKPPEGGKLVGIVHPDGQEAVDRWVEGNVNALAELSHG